MPIYYGANEIHDLYFAGNPIKEMYHGNTLVYRNTIPSFFETTAGEYTYKLQGGVEYLIIARGGGGAGGNKSVGTRGGNGGAGGSGELIKTIITPAHTTDCTIYVGDGGKTYGNGGNGGLGRAQTGPMPGNGGGGAKPSYVLAGSDLMALALGGGGGGGGGAGDTSGRYADGGGGGGGGGAYTLSESGEIIDEHGKNGGLNGYQTS